MLERRIEEASLNAWPALRQARVEGWILRFANGYTKRANSVNPLHPPGGGLEAAVAACERIYREQGLPPVFRLTSPFAPPELDELLERRGYRLVDPTLVLRLDLREQPAGSGESGEMLEETLDGWFPVHSALLGVLPETQAKHRAILEAIVPRRLFALRGEYGEAAACGLGVLEGDLFGLFDLVTAPERRGRGHGTALVCGMLEWARERGAAHAYLQVVEANAPARRLYEKLGFGEAYRYWYRVPPG
ncbi:MAG TPA: GNAT family N-acetyltransferase [Longimicrobium sp.]|jgi:GNAT superfamily N-acetyltransferase